MDFWRCSARSNEEMVDKFHRMGVITTKDVEEAFRNVPRGAFVPEDLQDEAYIDSPIRGDPHVHMSAPHMYASILEALDLRPGCSFLNIGSGTGYFSMLAGYVIKKQGINHGIELFEELVEYAEERCEEFLHYSPNLRKIICIPKFVPGNCFRLDSSMRSYDRVYCGAACPQSKINFLLQLTRIGGLLVAPCGNKLVKYERMTTSQVCRTSLSEVCFATLVMPSTEEMALPKLRFPDSDRHCKNKVKVYPSSSSLLLSKGPARKSLARLRALQEAIDCLEFSSIIPEPFCFVPCHEQMENLYSKMKDTTRSHFTSSVDTTINFFNNPRNSNGDPAENGLELENSTIPHSPQVVSIPSLVVHSDKGKTADSDKCDHWTHLHTDSIWETVLENYYSICTVTGEQKCSTLKVFVKQKRKPKASNTKCPSFSDLARKIGLLPEYTYAPPGGALTSNDCKTETSSASDLPTSNVIEGLQSTIMRELRYSLLDASADPVNQESHRTDAGPNDGANIGFIVGEVVDSKNITDDVAVTNDGSITGSNDEAIVGSNAGVIVGPNDGSITGPNDGNITGPTDGAIVGPNDGAITGSNDHSLTRSNDGNIVGPNGSIITGSNDGGIISPYNINIPVANAHAIAVPNNGAIIVPNNGTITSPNHNDNAWSNDGTIPTPNNSPIISHSDGANGYFNDSTDAGHSGSVDISSKDFENPRTIVASGGIDNGDLPLSEQGATGVTKTKEIQTPLDGASIEKCKSHVDDKPKLQRGSSLTASGGSVLIEKAVESSSKVCKTPASKTAHKSSKLVPLEVDHMTMAQLTGLPDARWTLEEDMELVKFLASQNGTGTKGMLKNSVRFGVIKPEMFTSGGLMRYPKISTFSTEILSYRAVVLHRVSLILDSVLFLLGGDSLLHDQYLKLTRRDKFPLESFSETSFMSSRKLTEGGGRGSVAPESCEDVQYVEKEKTPQAGGIPDDYSDSLHSNLSQKELLVVQAQQEIILQKIKALKGLQEQYNEQLRLLKKQVQVIEEQQQLLQRIRQQEDTLEEQQQQQQCQQQQQTGDNKLNQQGLIMKQQWLSQQEIEHEKEKGSLVLELKKLKEEEKKLIDRGEHKTRRTKLNKASLDRSMSDENLKSTKTWSKKSHGESLTSSLRTKFRHQPGTILPRIRFLLPLSQRRWPLVHEMLRSSELPCPEHLPIITVDRSIPLVDRHDHSKTVFVQVYNELKKEDLHFRWNKRRFEQWWEVKFVGEGIIDQGGGFRDSLAEISDELCPPEINNKEILPFFIKTPNQKSQFGENLDSYIPNPSCQQWEMYHWIGKLMGGAYRTDESLPISMPPLIWKVLVGEHVTWNRDFRAIDEGAIKLLDDIESLDDETFNKIYSPELFFVTVLSNGEVHELKPGGSSQLVSAAELAEYTSAVRKARMMESVQQIKAIREGLVTVIPKAVLGMLTWQELEKGVCGEPNISITLLKTSCQYSDDLSSTSDCVVQLWSVLKEFSNEERSRFLRFVTGRKRLPAPFMVAKSSGEYDCLPSASTCASTLYLPSYSVQDIAFEKIRYAIYNCVAIDTDTSPW